jgi:hypothetical protein
MWCGVRGPQPAHYNLGMLEFEAHRHAAALVHYERAAVLHPLYAEPHCNMGVVFKLQGFNLCVPLLCSPLPSVEQVTRGLEGLGSSREARAV